MKKVSGSAAPDLTTLGKRLAQARRELGVREGRDITPPDMAARVEVSAATYWRWEKDERRPTNPALQTVARALGTTVEWLTEPERSRGSVTPDVEAVAVTRAAPAKKAASGGRKHR